MEGLTPSLILMVILVCTMALDIKMNMVVKNTQIKKELASSLWKVLQTKQHILSTSATKWTPKSNIFIKTLRSVKEV